MYEQFNLISAFLAVITAPFIFDSWRRFSGGFMRRITAGVGFVYICGFIYAIAPFFITTSQDLDLIGRACVTLFFVGLIYINYTLNVMSRRYGFNEEGKKISNRLKGKG